MSTERMDVEEFAKDIREFENGSALTIGNGGVSTYPHLAEQLSKTCDCIMSLVEGGEVLKQDDPDHTSIVVVHILALEPDVSPFENVAKAVQCVVVTDVIQCPRAAAHLHVLNLLQLQGTGAAREASPRVMNRDFRIVPVRVHSPGPIPMSCPLGSLHEIHSVLFRPTNNCRSCGGPIVDGNRDGVVLAPILRSMGRGPVLNVVIGHYQNSPGFNLRLGELKKI